MVHFTDAGPRKLSILPLVLIQKYLVSHIPNFAEYLVEGPLPSSTTFGICVGVSGRTVLIECHDDDTIMYISPGV